MASAVVATIDPIIIGRYIEQNPNIFLYVGSASLIVICIVFLIAEIYIGCRNRTKPRSLSLDSCELRFFSIKRGYTIEAANLIAV